MGPPGGARNPVDPRFISLFSAYCIIFPSMESLKKIYSSMASEQLSRFGPSISKLADKIVDATMTIYGNVVHHLLPTPSKFHYIFNLRDLSRVFEGLCLSTPDKMETAGSIIRLWRNECLRVFHDRLINEDDKGYVIEQIENTVRGSFSDVAEQVPVDPILFGDHNYMGHNYIGHNYMSHAYIRFWSIRSCLATITI